MSPSVACTDAHDRHAAYARSMRPRLAVPLALALLAVLWAAAPAGAAVQSRGDLRITEGVRLSDLQFRSFVKDGELHLDVLLVGRALSARRSLVLSAAPCRGTQSCRTEASRGVAFRRRPQTLVGWHPRFRGAVGISGVRVRVAARGGAASRATADVVVASTAWTLARANTSMFVREDPTVPVDALHLEVAPVAGGAAVVVGSFTVHSTRAFDLRTTLGRCTPVGGCPLPDVLGTAAIPAGSPVTVPISATLPTAAGVELVRFRADGGVFPSPFVQMILPWPPA